MTEFGPEQWTITLDHQQTRRKWYHALWNHEGKLERYDRSIVRLIDAARAMGVSGPIAIGDVEGRSLGSIVGPLDER